MSEFFERYGSQQPCEALVRAGASSLARSRAPATLDSDGLGCFTVVCGMGNLHETHITGGDAVSAKHLSFLAVHTAPGNIKTSRSGADHAFGFRKHATGYLGQVQYLFNRRIDLRAILARLARAASQVTPCPLSKVCADSWPSKC